MIRVLLCYARSGGTLFSKFIASQENVIFLSEVNPNLNAVGSPAQQVNQWYGWQIDEKLSFLEQIVAIYQRCQTDNKQLVIRDFSFIDFTPHRLNNFKPVGYFSILEELSKIAEIKVLGFVRNSIDVWISRRCPPKMGAGYLRFVEQVQKKAELILKYEAFCETPKEVFEKAMSFLEINHWGFSKNALNYENITGDNLLPQPSRGKKENAIKLLPRKPIAPSLKRLALADDFLLQANRTFGYSENEIDFADLPLFKAAKLEAKHLLKLLFRRYPSDIF